MNRIFFDLKPYGLIIFFLLGIASVSKGQCPTGGAVVSRTHTDITCFGADDGTITVEIGDGAAPLNFELFDNSTGSFVTLLVTETNDPDGNGNFRKVRYSNVYPGAFQVIVFKTGCPPLSISETAFGFVVLEPTQLVVTIDAVDPDCDPAVGSGDGNISITASDGTPPYTYLWSDGATSEDRANIDAGTYTVTVTDANGCQVSDNATVAVVTQANAGSDQNVCADNTTLGANAAAAGEIGTWTVVSGSGFFGNANSQTSSVGGLSFGANVFRWTITDTGGLCPGTFDEVTITRDNPASVDAGAPQTICSGSTVTLAGVFGGSATSATWTAPAGDGSFNNPNLPGAVYTPGTNDRLNGSVTLVFTTNDPPNTCPAASDNVTITINAPATVDAGSPQTICAGNTATLAGTFGGAAIGVSWFSPGDGTFSVVTDPNAVYTPGPNDIAAGTVTLTLTTNDPAGPCPAASDNVTITINGLPTVANAGSDQTLCATNATLAGNTPVVGTGAWTIVSGAGGTVTTPSSPTSGFTGTAGVTYVLRWTISNSPCTSSSDDVQIIFDQAPTTAAAGTDQALCATSTTLAGNTPVVGTGAWTIISGAGGNVTTPASPTSGFTGTAGVTYVLRWTITNGTCPASTDDVQIRFDQTPTTAAAGSDQTLCATNTTLAGNTPVVGTGAWTIISGTGGTVTTPSSPASTFSGTAGVTYVLRWTITNGTCPSSADDVQIIFDQAPTTAAAGSDQTLCATNTTLAGNTPVVGTGAWTIVSGAGGTVTTPASPTSTFTGTAGVTYVLRWTITNGTCPASTDDVQIRFDQAPTTAAAGTDQALCGTSTSLAGNAPVVGTGAWTIVSGVGGAVSVPSSPTSGFSGTAGVTYVLRWTITNGTCPSSSDDVQITFDQLPTAANAGPNQNVCAATTLAGNTPVVGTGAWTIVSGAGGTITTPSSPTSGFNGTAGVTYVLRWTITNGTCPSSSDDVQIIFDQAPTTAAAGSDQTLCATNTTLAGNTPAVGTGAWTIISGAGGNVTTPSSPTSTFSGTAGVTYVLRWTITNGTCPSSSDDVQIIFDQAPTIAAAGSDQTLCATNTTLAGNTPVVGTGAWTIVSGAGGTVTTPASPTSTFTGTAGTTYVLRWTITNGTCPSSSDDVQIIFEQAPTTAAAGTDQALCATNTTLAGNAPVVGTGAWTIVSGAGGTVTTPASPTSTFSGTAGVTYVLRWTITNGTCPSSSDDVQIIFEQAPTTAAAGSDQTLCATNTTLAGNTPVVGTGAWTIVSGAGGTVTTPASPTSTFSGTAGVTYVLRWTITNGTCPSSSDDVQIIFEQAPTTAAAGSDQSLCATNTTLAGNTPVVGTGAWTIVSGAGGTVTTPASPTSTFTGIAGTTYVLRWTITNGSCPSSADDVQIIFDQAPTTAAAGPNQAICASNTTLAGNTPTIGTGQWTIVSGAGGSFGDDTDPASTFTGTAGTTYVLRWTITSSCGSSTDDVQIVLDEAPTVATAGADQTVCGPATLAANTPVVGTGAWTIQSGAGGTLTDPTDPTTAFSGTGGTTYTLRWTISNGACTASFDEVDITFDINSPTTANAGADQAVCAVTTALAGNTPVIGTGSWSIISGAGGTIVTPASPTSPFNGMPGTSYVLRWTITNGACVPSTDDVTIAFDTAPDVAAAGPDQQLCGTNTTLAANAPGSGTGVWTAISGLGPFIGDDFSPFSPFAGIPGETYILQWTISNSCGSTSDQVEIELEAPPTTAAAGSDQTVCGAATLAANTPLVGTGAWTIQSGVGGVLVDPANPTTTFSGTAGTTYTLRWTISNGSCTASFDEVDITFDINTPTTANAGTDQAVCATNTTLAGNTPVVGTGQWTIVSGAGGSFGDDTNPVSTFTGTAGTTYVLRWTITSLCGTSTDDVEIVLDEAPTVAAAGTDQSVCGPATLAANTPVVGTGAWTIQSGTGGTLLDPTDPTTTFSGTGGTTYTLRWTISSGSCTASFDEVDITFDSNTPTTANAGTDQSVCATTTTLAGNTPVVGTGAWSILSGAGGTVATPGSPTSTFDGIAGTTYVLRWTISNGACVPSTDDVTIVFDIAPTVADAGLDQQLCATTTTLAANAATSGTGLWTIVSGAGGSFVDATLATTGFSGTAGVTYTLQWTISNGCGSTNDQVDIEFEAAPTIAAAGSDQTVCGPATLAANTPVVGTGTWTIQSGVGGVLADPANPTTTFSGTGGTTYTLRWTISNGSCTDSFDEVDITFDINTPTTADAGTDQAVCNTTTALTGNTPVVGTGLWSIISGAGGTIVTPASPTSNFNGVAGTTYVLRWTISNGVCTPSTDDVSIAFDTTPTTAAAGTNQTLCATTATLAANTPTSGTGVWTIISGTGGSFVDANSPTSGFSGTAGQTYVLEWTISNSCGSSADQVTIIFEAPPTVSNAGTDQVICVVTTTNLSANTPTVGTGIWTIVSGAGGAVITATSPTSQFVGSLGVSYTLRWIITNGTCTPSIDDVVINFSASPATTSPVTACVNTAAPTLTAVAAGASNFNWYLGTGPSRVLVATTVTGSFTPGAAELDMSTPASTTFEVTAVYGCGESPGTQIVVNVSNTGACNGGTGNCATVVITPVPSPATCTNSDGSITFNINPFTPVVNNEGVIINIDGISTTNQTITRTQYNDPLFLALPIGVYDYTIVYGDSNCIKTGQVTIDQSGTVGTPIASNVINPVCAGTPTGSVTLDVPGETGNVLEWSFDGGITDPFKSFTAGSQVTGIPAGPAPTFERVISVRRNSSDPCFASVRIVIQDTNPAITVTFDTDPATCNGNDGRIFNIQGGGGSGGTYQYSIDGTNFQTEDAFDDIGGGTYTLTVQDGIGCEQEFTADVTFPGFVGFTATSTAADCSNNGTSGSLVVRFNAAGSYEAGVSVDPLVEPTTYVSYTTIDPVNDVPLTFDNLGRGTYYIFAKTSGALCPTRQGPFTIDGVYALTFDILPICNDNEVSISLTNLTGEPGIPFEIHVFEKFTSTAMEIIPVAEIPVTGSVFLDYDDHPFLRMPDEYQIQIQQVQSNVFCLLSSSLVDHKVSQPLAAQIGSVKESYPDILTGVMHVVNFNGGEIPYDIRIELDSAAVGGQFYQTDWEEVLQNSNLQYQKEYTNIPAGRYKVEVMDEIGCVIELTGRVPLDVDIYIPNIFTPNEDGMNDLFFIRNLPVANAQLTVTNRWGKQVYSSNNYQNNWAAEEVSDGIYFYRLKIAEGEPITGWVEVLRGAKP